MWQGIGVFYAQNPGIRYLFGSVSISGRYPKNAVDALVMFYRLYFHNPNFSVTAKNPYVIDSAAEKNGVISMPVRIVTRAKMR